VHRGVFGARAKSMRRDPRGHGLQACRAARARPQRPRQPVQPGGAPPHRRALRGSRVSRCRDHGDGCGVLHAFGRRLPGVRAQLGEPDPPDPRGAEPGPCPGRVGRHPGAAAGLRHPHGLGRPQRTADHGGAPASRTP
jgi:hypothetical protein